MRRREFIALVAAAICPVRARAAEPGPLRKVGMLMNTSEDDPEWKVYVAAFMQRLHGLGWVEGQNLRVDKRWSIGDPGRSRALATEVIRLAPDVIFSSSTANLTALLRQAPTMPIVFVQVSDPVAQGFVSNLAHPEGNITGISSYEFTIGGKWADLLKQVVPGLAHVSLIFNPDTAPQSKFFLNSVKAAAPALGIDVTAAQVHETSDFERVMADVARQPNSGLIFPTDNFTSVNRSVVVAAAVRHRLPAIFNDRTFVESGGLMSYGIEYEAIFRQAAGYVDRILKGAKPGDLPVQGPSKFSMVINVKTAKALGISVPMSLLLNADGYIE